jgi:hypothetical protein
MRLPLAVILVALCGCDPESSGTEVAAECVQSDLIAQCPPGSDPRLDAESQATCEAAGDVDLIEQEGSVSGKCYGEGSCQVLCQFESPCTCGVDTIDDNGIVCTDCGDLPGCGNGECEGMENAENCAVDCGPVCEAGRERCQGNDREQCNLQGRWELLACGDGTQCREMNGMTACE